MGTTGGGSLLTGSLGLQREFGWSKHPKHLISIAKNMFPYLTNIKIIDEWIYFVRQCRHPSNLWETDYLIPSNILVQCNELIDQSDNILFEQKDSTKLKEQYECSFKSFCFINIIRAYRRAESDDFESSLKIWDELYEEYLLEFTVLRQTNLLLHLFVVYLCSNQLEKAMDCLRKQWFLLRNQKESDRYGMGIWDNNIVANIILFYFSIYNTDLRNKICDLLSVNELEYNTHKKYILKPYLTTSLIATICSKPFYDLAVKNFNLPVCEEFLISDRTVLNEKYQNSLILEQIFNTDLIDDNLLNINQKKWELWYSEAKSNSSGPLIDLLSSIGIGYSSVIDLACGLSEKSYVFFKNNKLTSIDCCQSVHDYWKNKGREVIVDIAERYLQNCNKFDLCFCSDSFSYFVNPQQVMKLISQKCKYFALMVCCDEMGYFPVEDGIIKTCVNTKNKNEWISIFKENFKIVKKHEDGAFVFLIGESNENNN